MSSIKHKLFVLFKRIAHLIILENVYVLRCDMPILLLSPIDNRFATRIIDNLPEADLEEFKKYSSHRSAEYFEKHMLPRLKHPHWVAVSTFDITKSELAYVAWVVTKNTDFIKAMKINMKSGQFFLKDGFCIPHYRHHGVHQRMMQERINYCINQGAHECFIAIQKANKKGISNVKEFGFKLYQVNYRLHVKRKRILFIKRMKIS